MDYPDDFDTPAMPAGKHIAISRTFGIWSIIAFLVIIACCVAMPWLIKNRTINPFMIYVDGPNGAWELVGRTSLERSMPYYESVQRALVGIFTEKWFTISASAEKNSLNWDRQNRDTVCNRRVPITFAQSDGGDIYCMAGESIYKMFSEDVLPMYHEYESNGETWYVDPNKIQIEPVGTVSELGGTWMAHATIRSTARGNFSVIVYAKVARDSGHPQTLGYYIAGFNSYGE